MDGFEKCFGCANLLCDFVRVRKRVGDFVRAICFASCVSSHFGTEKTGAQKTYSRATKNQHPKIFSYLFCVLGDSKGRTTRENSGREFVNVFVTLGKNSNEQNSCTSRLPVHLWSRIQEWQKRKQEVSNLLFPSASPVTGKNK